jgi:glycerophosphoryl diester phosphodiesterase
MRKNYPTNVMIAALTISICGMSAGVLADCSDGWDEDERHGHSKGQHDKHAAESVQLGPRPFFLVDDMDEGKLKKKLQKCTKGPFKKSDFSIGHRGAALQFPEHTMESYVAAARMGAGILECDVTFTQDRELVCRHSQCDLHTTTDILLHDDLVGKCTVPPIVEDGVLLNAGEIKCCTSDITLAEFKTLCGKMDASNPAATTVEEYLGGTANWRTDLYASCGTLLSHAESIELFKSLGAKMTPELKSPSVEMPYQDEYTQEDYAQQMIDEYKAAGVEAEDVFAQSFNLGDVLYWIEKEPEFGDQAVYLDGRYNPDVEGLSPTMDELVDMGVEIIAPPMWVLLTLNESGKIIPSEYAMAAKEAGLDIITWTLERSFLGNGATADTWYHQTTYEAIDNPGDKYQSLHVLAKDVGILGIFSDWPATVTYYANCMNLD